MTVKQSWYSMYGLSHATITFLIMTICYILTINYIIVILAGLAAVAYWTIRETQGPDKEDPLFTKLFAYKDRIFDWVSPILAFCLGLFLYVI